MIRNTFLKKASIFIVLVLFSSCSNNTLHILETVSGSGITMEGRYWHGLFTSKGSFELRMTNSSGQDCKNCIIIFDSKYKHELLGLHTREKGMIKDSTFQKGIQLTIPFIEDLNNLDFFTGVPDGYIPETIELKCDNCDEVWKLK